MLHDRKQSVSIDGTPSCLRRPEMLSSIFFVPEEFELPSITMAQYVRLNRDFYPNFSDEILEQSLKDFELPTDINLGSLSMGQKKKAFISFALATQTEYLLLDEPTNGLDPAGIKDLRELFEKIASEKGVSLLISSHHLDELSRIANVYGILVDGRIVDETRKDDILAKCGTVVLLESSEPSKVLAALSPKGKVSVDGTKIRIEGNLSSGEVASLLVKEGVPFTSIQEQSLGFEDYFIERMGR